jgi:NAD(P)-dependent dehydrogenase (short-subunit alcohol dehydrogenase family)
VAIKHAVEGITKSVALEVVKSGIRVNAVGAGSGGDLHADALLVTRGRIKRL